MTATEIDEFGRSVELNDRLRELKIRRRATLLRGAHDMNNTTLNSLAVRCILAPSFKQAFVTIDTTRMEIVIFRVDSAYSFRCYTGTDKRLH